MAFEWSVPESTAGRLRSLQGRIAAEGEEVRFQTATLDTPETRAAEAIANDRGLRELLQEVSKAGFVREEDLLARRQRKEDELRARLDLAKNIGVVQDQVLLQCRSTGAPLTRLGSPEHLGEDVGALPCGSCGRRFSEERLTPGVLLSDLGKQLVAGSHWMTVWITKLLHTNGVPLESVLWNLEESAEEIDVVVEVGGELWIMELKDRDFQPGDANALNYRRVRYGADRTIIATTGKVSTQARRVFEELSKEVGRSVRAPARRARAGVIPVYLEGVAGIEKGLVHELDDAERQFAVRRLRPVAMITGFDYEKFLSSVF